MSDRLEGIKARYERVGDGRMPDVLRRDLEWLIRVADVAEAVCHGGATVGGLLAVLSRASVSLPETTEQEET